jgi:hypothetical protein
VEVELSVVKVEPAAGGWEWVVGAEGKDESDEFVDWLAAFLPILFVVFRWCVKIWVDAVKMSFVGN